MVKTDTIGQPAPYKYYPVEAFELFYSFCALFKAGKINFRQFSQGMKTFRFYDSSNRVWTIGARSGKWYRLSKSENHWVADEPMSRLTTTAEKGWYDYFKRIEQPEHCAACGELLPHGAGFCSKCGAARIARKTASQSAKQKAVYCRQCGRAMSGSAKFCNHCGAGRK